MVFIKRNIEEYSKAKLEKQKKLKEWIYDNLNCRKSINYKHSSYGLKHIAEKGIDEYVSNGEFIGAMIEAGYEIKQISSLNASFNISERSKAFR